jgi:hypothetical protein
MSNIDKKFKIRFEGLSVAQAGKNATQLRSDLLDVSQDFRPEIIQEDPTNQDFGATLVLVLGTTAVTAVAKGIAAYLSRARGTITIEADGKVVATGITGNDAAKIAEALGKRT